MVLDAPGRFSTTTDCFKSAASFLGQHARQDVGAAAGRGADHDAQGLVRPGLGEDGVAAAQAEGQQREGGWRRVGKACVSPAAGRARSWSAG
jgi:hypothetical protein